MRVKVDGYVINHRTPAPEEVASVLALLDGLEGILGVARVGQATVTALEVGSRETREELGDLLCQLCVLRDETRHLALVCLS